MIEATRRWFRRNRANLLVGAGVIGAGYVAGQYVVGRITEARQRMNEDRASKENLRRRFEQNQEDCTYTVLALLPTIRDEIIGALPVEQITEQLQQERQERLKRLAASEAPSSEYPSAPPSVVDDASTASFVHTSQMMTSSMEDRPKRSKAQLWQEMKINSIARALSLLYILSLLTLLTRIQLNLLGRRTYLSSVVSMASPPAADVNSSYISLEDRDDPYGNDFETNRMYLTFSWWILHRGAKKILDRVMAAVKEVFGQVNIREDMTLERLSELIIEVRRRVEGGTEQERRQQSWLEYLLPTRDEELFVINQATSDSDASPEPRSNPLSDVKSVSPSLRRLLDETADLIDSPTFSLVLGHLLDTSFSHLVDVRIASEAFRSDARVTELDAKSKLAHILPIFCRQAHAIVVGAELEVAPPQAVANEYLALIDRVHDLEAFAAVIYSSNFEYEGAESPNREAVSAPSVISLSDSQPLGDSVVTLDSAMPSSFSSAWDRAVPTRSFIESSGAPGPAEANIETFITDASIIDLSSVQDSMISATKSVASTISDTAAPVIANVRDAASEVPAKLNATAEAAMDQTSQAITNLQEVFGNTVTNVRESSASAAAAVQETASNVAVTTQETASDVAASAQKVVGDLASNARENASNAAATIQDTASDVATKARETTSNVAASAKDTASNVAAKARDATRDAAVSVQKTASNVAAKAQDSASKAAASAQDTAKNVAVNTQETARSIASNVQASASDAAKSTGDKVSKASANVQAVAADLSSNAQKTASKVSENVEQGASKATPAAKQTIKNTASTARDTATAIASTAQEAAAKLPPLQSATIPANVAEAPAASAKVTLPKDEALSQPAIVRSSPVTVPTMEAATELVEPKQIAKPSPASAPTPRQVEISNAKPAPVAPRRKP